MLCILARGYSRRCIHETKPAIVPETWHGQCTFVSYKNYYTNYAKSVKYGEILFIISSVKGSLAVRSRLKTIFVQSKSDFY